MELTHNDHDKIEELLLGKTVVKVDDHTLQLNDGTILKLPDTQGGCICGAGDYDLKTLNGVDNVITRVTFINAPDSDYSPYDAPGIYQIFVYADNTQINLATWEGSDGNGYYGTGYEIEVIPPG